MAKPMYVKSTTVREALIQMVSAAPPYLSRSKKFEKAWLVAMHVLANTMKETHN